MLQWVFDKRPKYFFDSDKLTEEFAILYRPLRVESLGITSDGFPMLQQNSNQYMTSTVGICIEIRMSGSIVIYIRLYVLTYVFMYLIYIYTYVGLCRCLCMYACILYMCLNCACMRASMYFRTHVFIYAFMHACTHTHIHTRTHACI